MVVNIDRLFSKRAKKLKGSMIRELLKLTQLPGMISLAGGLPSPKAFPVEIIRECIRKVFDGDINHALQYGSSKGVLPLRRVLAEMMREKKNIDCEEYDILITNGSQQALTLLSYTFIDPEDTVITGAPTYLAGVQAFHAFEARCEPIPVTDSGFDINSLRRNLRRLNRNEIFPKFIYTVPTFQNPSGVTMSLDKRKELLEIASEYDLLIVEDDPYGELVFEGEKIPPIKSLDEKGRVIYMSTFSKILAPGFRLGWVVASEEILNKLIHAKQPADLCTNTFNQYVASEYIGGGYLDGQLKKISAMYREKRDVMVEAIKEYFPEGVKWTVPHGGMFLWVTLPKKINTRHMFHRAIEKKVAYVVGDAFFPDGSGHNTMRLNFSYSENDTIREGIRRLSEVIKEELRASYMEEEFFADIV